MKLILPMVLASLALFRNASAQQVELDGQLFTNSQQRDYLDYLRKDYLAKNRKAGFDIKEAEIPEIPGETTTAANAAPVGPTEYSLGGILKRSDGSYVLWLNNKQLRDSELPKNMRLVTEGMSPTLRVRLDSGKTIELRPGQTYQIALDAFQERYQRPAATAPEAPSTPVAGNSSASTASNKLATGETLAAAAIPKPPSPTAATTSTTATDPKQPAEPESDDLIKALPETVRNNAEKLELMIQSLQTLREELDEKESP